MRALSPSPVRTAWRIHSSLITGSMPGMAASTSETCALASPPNSVDAPENNLARDATWAWTSMPMTTSQSPVAPLISLECCAVAFIGVGYPVRPRAARAVRHSGGGRNSVSACQRLAAALRAAEAAEARQNLDQRAIDAKLLRAPHRLRIAIIRTDRIGG